MLEHGGDARGVPDAHDAEDEEDETAERHHVTQPEE